MEQTTKTWTKLLCRLVPATFHSDKTMTSDFPLSAMLHHALGILSDHSPETFPILGQASCRLAQQRNNPVSGVYGGGLHHHERFEMCIATDGACRVWMPDGFFGLSCGSVVMIPPGVMHGEGWLSIETPYRLLWVCIAGEECEAFSDSYHPGRGWTVGGRVYLLSAGGGMIKDSLSCLTSHRDMVRLPALYELKGGLLGILARLLGQAIATESGSLPDHGEDLAEGVRRYLDLYYAKPLTVGDVACRFHLSPNYLNRVFSQRHGCGIHAYLAERRLEAAQRLLRQQDMLIKEVAFRVGFPDPLYFCRIYKKRFGCSPSQAR